MVDLRLSKTIDSVCILKKFITSVARGMCIDKEIAGLSVNNIVKKGF